MPQTVKTFETNTKQQQQAKSAGRRSLRLSPWSFIGSGLPFMGTPDQELEEQHTTKITACKTEIHESCI